MDINIKFIVFDKDEEKTALEVTQFNSLMYFHIEPQGSGTFNADVDGYTIGRLRVIQSNLGQPPAPSSNGTDAPAPRKNFGLNMHKIHAFLTKMKPTVIAQMDSYLAGKPFSIPKCMFFCLFDMNLDSMKFEFHKGYLEMAFNPTYHDPVYDDTTEPRFIYEEFKPKAAPAMDSDDFTYEERIDD